MQKNIIKISIVVFILLIAPIIFIVLGFSLPPQFGATYYAELPFMFERLKKAEGKRIIVVGGSGIAFGLRGDLAEQEIEDYTVCPFGLYGAIGTKAMMDLSKVNIKKGDIVLLMPEQAQQSLSLFFNGENIWKAADSNFDIIKYVSEEDAGNMVGAFIDYTVQKFSYWQSGAAPQPTGVYASSSFDENCIMTYDRPYNRMQDYYDANNRISFSSSIISPEFIEYVNKYNSYIESRGAKLLFGFAPVNSLSLETGTALADINSYYDYISQNLDCNILGSPHSYIFDYDWFYDSNVHCNSAGAIVYTRQLVNDLKVYFGITAPTEIQLPEKPEIPREDSNDKYVKANNADANFFDYAEVNGDLQIVGMTAEGKNRTSVTVPAYYEGKKVVSFAKSAFTGNKVIEEIKLQFNIRSIPDGSFEGCTNLKRLYLPADTNPSQCNVYGGLFNGAGSFKIYVPSAQLSNYMTDYFWSRYASDFIAY